MLHTAVRRLRDEPVAGQHWLRVAQDRPPRIPQVTCEAEALLPSVLGHRNRHRSRPQDMTRIPKLDFASIDRTKRCAIANANKQLQCALGVILRIQRLDRRLPFLAKLLVVESRVALLDVRAVHEHQRAEIVRGMRRENAPAESGAVKSGQHPRMIDVSVRKQHGVDRRRLGRKRAVDGVRFGAAALKQAAVKQQLLAVLELEQVHLARHVTGCAPEGEFHDDADGWGWIVVAQRPNIKTRRQKSRLRRAGLANRCTTTLSWARSTLRLRPVTAAARRLPPTL